MPDIYSNGSPDIQAPVGYRDAPAPLVKLTPVVVPYSEGTKPALTDEDLFKNSLTSAIGLVQDQPWAKAEQYTKAAVKTPLQNTYRYNDPKLGFNPTDPNQEQKYAANQGVIERFINRTLKFGANAGLAAFGTIDSTMSFLSGNDAVESIPQIENSKWQQDLDSYVLPNYQTQYQKDNPYASYFTPWNFKSWIDNVGNVGQQLGFTVGALAATAPIDFLLATTGNAAIESLILPKQLERIFSGLSKMSRVIAEGGEEYNAFLKTVNSSENVVKGINDALKTAGNFKKGVDFTRFASGVAISAYGESIMEGIMTGTQVEKDLQDKYRDEFGNFNGSDEIRKEIHDTSRAAAKSVVGPNFAFLAVSNALGYGNILRPARAAVEATEKILANEAKVVLNPSNINNFTVTPLNGIWNRVSKPLSMIKDNLRESAEEGYQFLVSNSSKNYYERQFDNKSSKETISLANEYSKSFSDLFGTQEGFDNIFIGFLSGFAQHGIKVGYDKATGNYRSGKQVADNIATQLNSVGVTDIFNNTRKEAITSTDLAMEMAKAAKEGDIFKYKNLQHEQLFNFVSTAVNSNKFDSRIEQLQALKNLSDENFKFTFGIEANEDNKKTAAQYVDNVIEKAKEIKGDIQQINYVFGENPFSSKKDYDNYDAFNNYKTELAITLSKQKEYIKRSKSLSEEIFSKVSTADLQDITNLSTDKGIGKTIESFEKKIKDLKESEKLATGNDVLTSSYKREREFLEEKVSDLKSNMSEFNPDMFIQTLKELYNYHNNLNSLDGNSNVNELDVLSIYNNSKDLNKLIYATKDAADYYTALARQSGFDSFKNKFIKAKKEAYSLLANQVEVDENGNMRFKPDEEEVVEPEVVSEEDLNDKLEAINAATPEEIAKAMNPNYENEPDSEEYKIAKGEVEVTEEIKNVAKERIKEQFESTKRTSPKKESSEPTSSSVPVNETPEQRKQRRASEASSNQGTKTGETKTETPKPAKEATSVVPATSVEKFWDGLFSPLKMFFKLFSKGATNEFPIDYKENLRSLIFGTSSKEEVNSLLASATITVAKSTSGKDSNSFGKYPIQGKIYRKGQALEVTLNLKGKPVGLLNEPDSLYYKDGDEFKPLHEITSPSVYESVTGNPAKTFEAFKKEADAYREAYNKLVESHKDEAVTIPNEEIVKLFKTVLSYGSYDSVNKAELATLIKDLKYKPKGSAILSFPMIYNEEKDIYERQSFPTILNKEELTVEQLADVADFFEKHPNKADELNSRYAYLLRMPDGSFSSQSFLVARPANESEVNIDDFISNLKLSITEAKNNTYTLKSINEFLGNALYISHSKKNDNRKTHIRFSVSSKDHSIALNIHNKKLGVSVIEYITEDELNSINSVDEFINYVNNRIADRAQRNTPLKSLGIKIDKESFKKHLANDDKVTSEDLVDSLTVPVTPSVFKDYSINLYPHGSKSPKKESTKRADKVENPKIKETHEKYVSTLKPIVEKRTGSKNMSDKDVIDSIQDEDIQKLLDYYEAQREKQATNYIYGNQKGNFTANTSEWDSKIKELREYLKLKSKKVRKKSNVVSKAQMEIFVDKNIVPDDILQDIAQKVIDNEKLTTEEQAIFVGRTGDINQIIKEIKDAEENLIDATSSNVSTNTSTKPSTPSTPSTPAAYDINSIISQLEAKGIVKKDCK